MEGEREEVKTEDRVCGLGTHSLRYVKVEPETFMSEMINRVVERTSPTTSDDESPRKNHRK